MTTQEALEIFNQPDRIVYSVTRANNIESAKYNKENQEAYYIALDALKLQASLSKENICEVVKNACKELNIDFFFVINGKSCWSNESSEHINKIIDFHKKLEKEYNNADI